MNYEDMQNDSMVWLERVEMDVNFYLVFAYDEPSRKTNAHFRNIMIIQGNGDLGDLKRVYTVYVRTSSHG